MGGQTQNSFRADSRAPAAARAFVRDAVGQLMGPAPAQAVFDDLELVVSELVTNAVRAGTEHVDVGVDVDDTRLVVRVHDQAQGWPAQRSATSEDPGGRGLRLVEALSSTWGVRAEPPGKVVWAELTVPQV